MFIVQEGKPVGIIKSWQGSNRDFIIAHSVITTTQ